MGGAGHVTIMPFFHTMISRISRKTTWFKPPLKTGWSPTMPGFWNWSVVANARWTKLPNW